VGFLTREAILAASDLKRETASVPEWGGEIIMGEMSGVDREDWDANQYRRQRAEEAAARVEKRPVDPTAASLGASARLVAWTARTPEGGDLFAVRRPDGRIDVAATEVVAAQLAQRSGAVLDRLARVAHDLCGWGAKAIEAAEGNSDGIRSA